VNGPCPRRDYLTLQRGTSASRSGEWIFAGDCFARAYEAKPADAELAFFAADCYRRAYFYGAAAARRLLASITR
jgi:hypothetical protein